MQAAQAVATQAKAREFAPVGHDIGPGGEQARHEILFEIARAKAVDQDMHPDAARGGMAQGAGYGMADFVVGVNVAFEIDLRRGCLDVGKQAWKVFASRIEQGDLVAGQEFSGHVAPGMPTARRGRKWPTTDARNEPRFAAP